MEIDECKKNIGKKLKILREERGISTYKLGKEGIRFEVIQAIEEGTTNYTIDNLIKYINAAGIDFNFNLKE